MKPNCKLILLFGLLALCGACLSAKSGTRRSQSSELHESHESSGMRFVLLLFLRHSFDAESHANSAPKSRGGGRGGETLIDIGDAVGTGLSLLRSIGGDQRSNAATHSSHSSGSDEVLPTTEATRPLTFNAQKWQFSERTTRNVLL